MSSYIKNLFNQCLVYQRLVINISMIASVLSTQELPYLLLSLENNVAFALFSEKQNKVLSVRVRCCILSIYIRNPEISQCSCSGHLEKKFNLELKGFPVSLTGDPTVPTLQVYIQDKVWIVKEKCYPSQTFLLP